MVARSADSAGAERGGASYRALLNTARADSDVLGVILSGSRGAGRASAHSDYDVILVVRDAAVRKYRRRFTPPPHGLDVSVQGVTSFERGADRKPQTEGSGPAFAHIRVPIDKTGRVAKFARVKARIPRGRVRSYTAAQLDAYLNELLRSLKSFRDGDSLAGHLEATRSVPYLLETVFGSEGRWAPYGKYLEWELREFPLRTPPLPADPLLRLVGRILKSGDVRSQGALFFAVERNLRARGYGRVFDGWGPTQLNLFRSARLRRPIPASGPTGAHSVAGVGSESQARRLGEV
jgi:hypothetical protein